MVGEGDLLRDEREKTPVGKLRLWNWEGLGRGPPDLGRRFGEGSREETREGGEREGIFRRPVDGGCAGEVPRFSR